MAVRPFTGDESPIFHPSDEDLSLGTPRPTARMSFFAGCERRLRRLSRTYAGAGRHKIGSFTGATESAEVDERRFSGVNRLRKKALFLLKSIPQGLNSLRENRLMGYERSLF